MSIACASYLCQQYGCQGHCGQFKVRPSYYQQIPTVPVGCICPATSEQTCLSKYCPRKLGHSTPTTQQEDINSPIKPKLDGFRED